MESVKGEEVLDPELLKLGLEKLDDALSYFDEMSSFEGKVLSASIYVALRYGENISEFN